MAGTQIRSILNWLNSETPEAGWIEFLACYTALLRNVVSNYESDEGRAQDCFEYVCAKLSDDAFRRLTAFRPDGPARFRTWLTAVAANLCVDWRRSVYGRSSTPDRILKLPQLDQAIFHCFFRQGMTRQECLQVLLPRFPRLSLRQIGEINARIHAVLTPRQRWQLSAGKKETIPIDAAELPDAAADNDPEVFVQIEQDRLRMNKALARLEPQQRLILQLRFQQDLTLDETARLIGLSDAFQARRRIDAALAALAKAMKF